MGDDIDAPHKKLFRNFEQKNFEDLFIFLTENYLPTSVIGGTTWLIKKDEKQLGIIEMPSTKKLYFVPKNTMLEKILNPKDVLNAELYLGKIWKWRIHHLFQKYYT